MAEGPLRDLSRRERQIMDIMYRRGRASVAEVGEDLPDRLSYSTVRALLNILETKGYLRHVQDGRRYVYLPVHPRRRAGRAALGRVLQTFYEGSIEKAVAALLDVSEPAPSAEELERIARLIEQARKEGR